VQRQNQIEREAIQAFQGGARPGMATHYSPVLGTGIMAGLGAASEYDSENKATSIARGAAKGGVIGAALFGAPAKLINSGFGKKYLPMERWIKGPSATIPLQKQDTLRGMFWQGARDTVGLGLLSGNMESNIKDQQKREMDRYYHALGQETPQPDTYKQNING
jgi:hypothetical protein